MQSWLFVKKDEQPLHIKELGNKRIKLKTDNNFLIMTLIVNPVNVISNIVKLVRA